MKTSGSLFPGLCRSLALALCVGAAPAILTVLPGVVRAEAMDEEAFAELCETGTADQIRQALKDGANPASRRYGEFGSIPALTLAAGAGNLPAVRVLLPALRQAGHIVDEADVDIGETALAAAAGAAKTPESLEMIRLLLEAGADVNSRDVDKSTPLMKAAERNDNPEAVRMLLAAGAKLDDQNDSGWTALMHAARANTEAVVRALLDAGANRSLKDDEGHDALWHARESAKEGLRNIEDETARRAEDGKVVRLLEGGKKPSGRRR